MADTPSIDLEIANGTYRFALPLIAQIKIERDCGAPFGEVAARVMRGRFQIGETTSSGLITEAAFGARDFDAIIAAALLAGRHASIPGHPDYVFEAGDLSGWFQREYMSKWTIDEKWTIAAAIIGAMFYGKAAATNLPRDQADDADDIGSGDSSTDVDVDGAAAATPAAAAT